ncbi:hypothetical protein B0H13DRAFT_2380531 [Mycena leptocephala]|nr:hypothetical protein B0H13DRAFT_2380531 [Mycena leptocephala]
MLSAKVLIALALACISLATPQTGTVFRIIPGEGACGYTNTSDQAVGSVSATTFWGYPGANPKNSNKNPICHHSLVINANNQTVTVQIVDYFPENKHAGPKDVGIPDFEFMKFAPLKDGIVPNAQWDIV